MHALMRLARALVNGGGITNAGHLNALLGTVISDSVPPWAVTNTSLYGEGFKIFRNMISLQ